MTRWNLDDLAQRILERSNQSSKLPDWEVIRIPALAEPRDTETGHPVPDCDPREEGEALWPEKKSRETLEGLRESDEEMFLSMFQNRPVPEGGNILQKGYFAHRWSQLPNMGGKLYWSVDPKGGSSNPRSAEAAIQLWYNPPDTIQLYLLDQHVGIWSQSETEDRMRDLLEGKYWWPWSRPPNAVIIENSGDGPGIKGHLSGEIPGMILENADKNKKQRGRDAETYCKAGNIILPEDSHAGWVKPTVEQIAHFPDSVRADRYDALTQMINWYYSSKEEKNNAMDTLRVMA